MQRYLGKPPPRKRPGTASLGKYLSTIEKAGGWGELQRVLRTCGKIAKKHGVSIANVATRWVLDQPGVAAVIIGARLGKKKSATHINENIASLHFELDAEDLTEIEDALSHLAMLPGDCGDEYRGR
eukprot:COSAG05_NODE_8885_length_664_cov_1.357522_2_plen_126_part_00